MNSFSVDTKLSNLWLQVKRQIGHVVQIDVCLAFLRWINSTSLRYKNKNASVCSLTSLFSSVISLMCFHQNGYQLTFWVVLLIFRETDCGELFRRWWSRILGKGEAFLIFDYPLKKGKILGAAGHAAGAQIGCRCLPLSCFRKIGTEIKGRFPPRGKFPKGSAAWS